MSRPDPRRQASLPAAFAGAVDLSSLAQRPAAAAPAAATAPPAGPGAEFVLTVTEADFPDVIQASTQVPVVFDLWSARSPDSPGLSAMLIAAAQRGGGAWVLARVDVDAHPRIAEAFAVESIPTVIAVAAGQPVGSFAQVPTEPQLQQWLTQLLDQLRETLPGIKAAEAAAGGPPPAPVDPRFTEAEILLDAGDFAGAIQAYQAILNAEPANAEAAAALGQVVFLERVTARRPDAIDHADGLTDAGAADFVEAQCAAADLEVAAGLVAPAFTRLIGAIKQTSGDERTVLREHLVSLFGLFTSDDPQVVAARRSLAAALF